MKNVPLHWRILLGMLIGVAMGVVAVLLDANGLNGQELNDDGQLEGWTWALAIVNWIKPFGTIFINGLKLVAVPLIVASLIKGVTDLQDLSKLSSMGGRTIVLYLITTAVAVVLGLTLATLVGPARGLDADTREALAASTQADVEGKLKLAAEQSGMGPLQPLVDLVPQNLMAAAADNGSMLQVIVFVLFFSVGLLLSPPDKAKPVKDFFDGVNEVVLKLIDLIMLYAPIGVLALMAAMVAETQSWSIFLALMSYCLCVLFGLAAMVTLFYPLLVRAFTGVGYGAFFKGISPAQLLAFSTSSSAATLPVTMERVEEHLGVDEEVASFVLPIGATINMDGTSLYQAVAAVFIAQAYGVDLSFGDLVTVALTAILASVGTAAVPSAGIVMLVAVLRAVHVPVEGIALILPVDRVLDMCRTIVNVTSDATVAMLVAKSAGKLTAPHEKHWDDYYPPRDEGEETPESTDG
ncbi:Proton glutamate symport protein [Posidoniimonas polymericola]|uniref:Proton glutamate symport protein n=1 Tax=Posidoniimonas polymericola TaxID=2528002 RepID=A0A5C5YH27_9BACT|nr:dicarboxylate/amino acid:cation symporter [Posidoniimonas polymericola]TWT73815.1 Proton glutamate symport protein [Posidoniimonas polymericola]